MKNYFFNNSAILLFFLSFLAFSCVDQKKEPASTNPTNPALNDDVPVKKNDTIVKEVVKVKADSAKENNVQVKIDSPVIKKYNQVAKKPVIYAYCDKKTDISIELQIKGTLTFSYPLMSNNLWNGKVIPNEGIQVDGKIYPYLFWESLYSDIPTQVEESGFVVEGKNSIAFLEEKLNLMGLNQKEITDFITFWGPQMQENKYNFVHFTGTEAYNEQIASININPKPDNLFRLFMYFRPMNNKMSIKEQVLPKINSRAGLTIVEWGGSELKALEQVN
jgi:hypothetical protein